MICTHVTYIHPLNLYVCTCRFVVGELAEARRALLPHLPAGGWIPHEGARKGHGADRELRGAAAAVAKRSSGPTNDMFLVDIELL